MNHGKYDNIWTAEYETRLQQAAKPVLSDLLEVLTPNYGVDVRISNGNVLGSGQNEFQIDVNPTNSLNAIGTSNDGQTAGVGIFRTTDGGFTWTSRDASFYGVQAACCDPGNAFGTDGKAYAIILDTSPAATYILRSTDGGGTWRRSAVSTPDRPNVAVDPTDSNIVYITFTDFNQPAGPHRRLQIHRRRCHLGNGVPYRRPHLPARLPAIEPAARSLQRLDLRRLPGV